MSSNLYFISGPFRFVNGLFSPLSLLALAMGVDEKPRARLIARRGVVVARAASMACLVTVVG